nr:hypothetical protein [Tanacetum cinerariifolium]
KFVGDFKSLANEADASLAKHMALKLEIERLLKAIVSQDIMIIVQNESVVDTSDLQTELERTKERFENCIIKKETEYAKQWNDWYKKCDECKYDKISYDKAYKDMQQKIKWLQAQLGDLKLFKKVSDQENNTQDTSKNTKFAKQPIVENLPKIGKTNALSNSVTSNSVSTPQESKGNTKTRRPQPRSNTKHDRVPSASKSRRSKNKEAEVEEHHRNLLLSKNNKHISSACNNIQIDSQDVIQICLWCVDSGCSKHMTGNLKLFINFVWKFMGTVRFRNDHVAAILGLGLHRLTTGYISLGLVQNVVSPTTYVPPSKKDYEILFQILFDEYFNHLPHAISPDLVVVAAQRAVDLVWLRSTFSKEY